MVGRLADRRLRRLGDLRTDTGTQQPPAHHERAGRPRRFLAFALFSVAFGTNVSTPLLVLYQERLDLSTLTTTMVFAVYPLGLLPALLLAGPASDALGRRRLMAPGIVASAGASILMMFGDDRLWALFAGRLLLGAVSGVVFVTASAWMAEISTTIESSADPLWPARLNGMVLYGGFGAGAFIAGVLAQWAPWPLLLPYGVHLVLIVGGLVAVTGVPETVTADRSVRIRPSWGVPADAQRAFVEVVAPTALAVFGFASLALGLFPILLRPAMRSAAVFATGLIALLATGAIFTTQRLVARIGVARAASLALSCGAIGCALGVAAFASDWWPLVFPSAVVLGAASGLAMTAGLRFVDILTAPETRGAMTGAFYGIAYAAMTTPALVSSIARTRAGYVAVLSAMIVLALAAAWWLRRRAPAIVARSARTRPIGHTSPVTER